MYRSGISTIDCLQRAANKIPVPGAVDVALFPEIQKAISDPVECSLLEAEILRNLRFSNGTYKRTHASRFNQFDSDLVQFVLDSKHANSLDVLDLAVSNAVTSVDLWDALRDGGVEMASFLATDLYLHVEVETYSKGRIQLVRSTDGAIVQIRWGSIVINMFRPESWLFFPVNRSFIEFFVPGIVSRCSQGYYGVPEIKTIDLVSRNAIQRASREPKFRLAEASIFDPPSGTYGVVRAMNVLNEDYFDSKELSEAFTKALSAVAHDGLFVFGSNGDSGTDVSGGIYRRVADSFVPLTAMGVDPTLHQLIVQSGRRSFPDHPIGVS